MGLMNYLFGFHGRINRRKMWLFVLVLMCMEGIYLGAILGLCHILAPPTSDDGIKTFANPFACSPLLVFAPPFVFMFYTFSAASAKRLHDRSKSAWWLLFFQGIPLSIFAGAFLYNMGYFNSADGGQQAPLMQQYPLLTPVIYVVYTGILIWFWIEILLLPGTKEDNRFGPAPSARRTA